jgi:hypothetical protein
VGVLASSCFLRVFQWLLDLQYCCYRFWCSGQRGSMRLATASMVFCLACLARSQSVTHATHEAAGASQNRERRSLFSASQTQDPIKRDDTASLSGGSVYHRFLTEVKRRERAISNGSLTVYGIELFKGDDVVRQSATRYSTDGDSRQWLRWFNEDRWPHAIDDHNILLSRCIDDVMRSLPDIALSRNGRTLSLSPMAGRGALWEGILTANESQSCWHGIPIGIFLDQQWLSDVLDDYALEGIDDGPNHTLQFVLAHSSGSGARLRICVEHRELELRLLEQYIASANSGVLEPDPGYPVPAGFGNCIHRTRALESQVVGDVLIPKRVVFQTSYGGLGRGLERHSLVEFSPSGSSKLVDESDVPLELASKLGGAVYQDQVTSTFKGIGSATMYGPELSIRQSREVDARRDRLAQSYGRWPWPLTVLSILVAAKLVLWLSLRLLRRRSVQ